MPGHEDEETREHVRRQIAAMGARRYELGVKRADGHVLPLVLTPAALVGRVAWLVRENLRGGHIFIRPEGLTGLILIDDLGAEAVAQLRADGLAPAVVVETSPANHQVWVRLAPEGIEPGLATAAARLLAKRYHGDPNSATWRHYGRLAGFENRKPAHRRADGSYPLVRVLATGEGVAPAGGRILAAARSRMATSRVAGPVREDARAGVPIPVPWPAAGPVSPLGRLYRSEIERLGARYPAADLSRLDWMIVVSLAHAFPTADAAELARALVEGSPRLEERKAGHVADYVARTVSKALALARTEQDAR